MRLLEERIQRDGIVKSGDVLKVDSFLNHQMDVALFEEMALEWKRAFDGKPINKILTIEASGIGIAAIVARVFNVPVVFAKKAQSINLDGTVYATRVQSFTHGKIFDVIVSKKFVGPEDHLLLIDDFMANGCAMNGLIAKTLVRRSRALALLLKKVSRKAVRSFVSAAISLNLLPLLMQWTPNQAR